MSAKALKNQLIRIPEDKYMELILLDSSILDAHGNVRYGSLNKLFNKLLNQHIENIKAQVVAKATQAIGHHAV